MRAGNESGGSDEHALGADRREKRGQTMPAGPRRDLIFYHMVIIDNVMKGERQGNRQEPPYPYADSKSMEGKRGDWMGWEIQEEKGRIQEENE